MANVGQGSVRLLDSDGDSLDQNGELKVSNASIATLGTSTYSETSTKATIIGAVRNDSLAALANTDNEIAPLQVNASGALYVEAVLSSTDNTVLDDISGKLTAIDSDTNAIKSAVEGTLTVNTISGFATSAKQPSLGTAGSASANVITVQGISSMTPLIVDLGSNNDVTVSGTVTANLSATDNAVLDNILLDTSAIKTAIQVLDDWDDSNYANVNLNLAGTDAPTGGGGEDGALRVTIANDSTGVITVDGTVTANLGTSSTIAAGLRYAELQEIHDDTTVMIGAVYADDADWTDGSSKHMLIGGLYQSSMQSVTDGDVGPLQIDANGQLKVALSDTDNGVLDTIDSVLDTIKVDTEAIETAVEAIQVDAAAIEVLLTDANVDHAANEALLTTIDVDTGAIKTAVEIIDNAISGNEMQVDVVASLPAGTNNIGDVDALSAASVTEYAQFDVDTSAIQLSSADGINTATTECKEVILQCDFDNTGYVMVGGSSNVACDARGIRLEAGDTLTLSIQDTADIYLIGSANDQMVNVMVLK
jgi:uncharacterized protein YggU (UPF0235/DUF167 family)